MSYAIPQIEEIDGPSPIAQRMQQMMINQSNIDSSNLDSNGIIPGGDLSTMDSNGMTKTRDEDPLQTENRFSRSSDDFAKMSNDEINKMMTSQLVQLYEKTRANILQGFLSAHMSSVSKIGQLTQSINQV